MSSIFLHIVNMSISATWIVLAVLILRLLLKKAPKWIRVLLWGIVAIRLICPFSMESVMSLIPSAETISPEIMMENKPVIDTGLPIINNVINPVIGENFSPAPDLSGNTNPNPTQNPLQVLISVFSGTWMAGIVIMLAYTVISYLRVKNKIGTAVLLHENIFQSEGVVSPFVLGIIKPRIYLPFHMNEQDMEHVIAHENAHIRRKDHWWKPFGFLVLTLHWFNPFIWLGYVLLCRDIELACDEKVVKELDYQQKADYAQALLNCSVNRRIIAACPIAFGESGVKDRVKTVLNYKKPAFWIITVAIIASVIVAVCFLTDPVSRDGSDTTEETGSTEQTEVSEKTVSLEANYEMKTHEEIEITHDYSFQIDNKTPYQNLLTKTVDIHMFAQYFDMYGTGRGIDDVMEVIGVECLRKTPGGAIYSIHKVEQGGLLYIFYNYEDERAEIKTNEIRHWFYVMKRQTSEEIRNLEGKGATIDDIIKINGAEQIYLNCYRADPKFQGGEDGVLTTYHYFTDGILEIRYYWIQGEFVCVPYFLTTYFNLEDRKAEEYSTYNALIYGMDWVE